MKNRRPAPDFTTGPVTRWLRVTAVIAMLAITAVALVNYSSLPGTIPTHFDAAGQADGWGSRTQFVWLIVIWTLMTFGITWLSTKPHVFNYPDEVTPERAQGLYREGERMMVAVLAGLVVLYGGMVMLTFGQEGGLLIGFGLITLVGATLGGIIRISLVKDSPA